MHNQKNGKCIRTEVRYVPNFFWKQPKSVKITYTYMSSIYLYQNDCESFKSLIENHHLYNFLSPSMGPKRPLQISPSVRYNSYFHFMAHGGTLLHFSIQLSIFPRLLPEGFVGQCGKQWLPAVIVTFLSPFLYSKSLSVRRQMTTKTVIIDNYRDNPTITARQNISLYEIINIFFPKTASEIFRTTIRVLFSIPYTQLPVPSFRSLVFKLRSFQPEGQTYYVISLYLSCIFSYLYLGRISKPRLKGQDTFLKLYLHSFLGLRFLVMRTRAYN